MQPKYSHRPRCLATNKLNPIKGEVFQVAVLSHKSTLMVSPFMRMMEIGESPTFACASSKGSRLVRQDELRMLFPRTLNPLYFHGFQMIQQLAKAKCTS